MARVMPIMLAVLVLAAGACADDGESFARGDDPVTAVGAPGTAQPVRLLFTGDVMLGRRVGAVVATDPMSVFGDVRHTISHADFSVGNLESPLGEPSFGDESLLIADPVAADLLAAAGFDAMSVANNHAGDTGPGGVAATAAVLAGVGVAAVGRASNAGPETLFTEPGGVRVALLAFDLTMQGPAPGDDGGVAHWDPVVAERTVRQAVSVADVVTVGLHGGVEYLPAPDPALVRAAEQLAGWGADVVWSHGSHVPYDTVVRDPDGDGRSTVIAYGLGNLLFDQRIAGTDEGRILEVIAGADGVVAFRVAAARHDQLRVGAPRWQLPDAPAALLHGTWWHVVTDVGAVERWDAMDHAVLAGIGEVTAVDRGDVDGDGSAELVVAFLREFRPTLVNQRLIDGDWIDAGGRTAHLGVYREASLEQIWVAGSVPKPIVDLAVCDGGVAVIYAGFDGDDALSGGAWWWRDFGFAAAADVPGTTVAVCADIDGDGHSDPLVMRSS